jgi:hypothetical protein
VVFDECVMVLPQELQPPAQVPFSSVRDWSSVRIHLSRSSCNGTCPVYSVDIVGDGTVFYEGRMHAAIVGKQRASISREAMEQLVGVFRDADYYSLTDEYVANVVDISTFETSIEIDGRKKKVKDCAGLWIGVPVSVFRLENAIDQFAGTKRWTKSDARSNRWD